MSKYFGQLELTETEVQELEDSPQLLHLYNARRIWEDLKGAQLMYEALYNLISLASPHFSDKTQMLALSEANAAIRKAEGK